MKVVLTHFYAAPWCDMMMIAAQQMTSFIPLFDALIMTTATMMMLMLKFDDDDADGDGDVEVDDGDGDGDDGDDVGDG